MATMKHIVGRENAEMLYALKDRLKIAGILSENPMGMNRTRFMKYLSAKAESIIIEGNGDDAAFRRAELVMQMLDTKWRAEAKRINETQADIVHVTVDMMQYLQDADADS